YFHVTGVQTCALPIYNRRLSMSELSPPPASDASAAAPRPAPRSPGDLFVSFTLLALQGFGGVLAIVQREMVEKKKWLTTEEFLRSEEPRVVKECRPAR